MERKTRALIFATLAAVVAAMLYEAHGTWLDLERWNGLGSDYEGTLWTPAHAILHGRSPYPSVSQALPGLPAVYLPPIFIATLPLGLLPAGSASWVWLAILVAATVAMLALLEVRNPWCYALALLSAPFVQAYVLGNASVLIALGAALAWRLRHHPWAGPAAVACTVSVKFWLWPLIAWLLIVDRRSGLRAAGGLVALTLLAWALIRFDGLLEYRQLMRLEFKEFAAQGSLFVGALVHLGLGIRAAPVLGLLGGLLLLAAAWWRRASQLTAFALAILAALVATPVAWPHYLVLSAVPLIVAWPNLSLAWVWFPATWIPGEFGAMSEGQVQRLGLCILAAAPTVALLLTQPHASHHHTGDTSP
jgi:hypothetical protein